MNIAIVCYASVGGSGIVATELAQALVDRGHTVHIFSSEPPFRLRPHPRLAFEKVETPAYPLFREPQYLLSLANKLVEVGRRAALDIVHAHYAIPHAPAAFLARQVLHDTRSGQVPRIVTTLHGTDITIVGSDPSYRDIVAYSIDQADLVTAVSASLRDDTYDALPVRRDIRVIHNFLDCGAWSRQEDPALRAQYVQHPDERLVLHVSNLRPVKRVGAVVDVFAGIAREVPARLLIVGEGPELDTARARAVERGVADRLTFIGEASDIVALLSIGDLFLLPSAQESFGLAAVEAMACGVPVVASRVGGLPEVVAHGVTGFLHDVSDHGGMVRSGLELLRHPSRHRAIARAAREDVERRFCTGAIVPLYEQCYIELLEREPTASRPSA